MLKIILLILFILSVSLLFLDRIYRIEEEMTHARLIRHAGSALPPSLFELWRTRKPPTEDIKRWISD